MRRTRTLARAWMCCARACSRALPPLPASRFAGAAGSLLTSSLDKTVRLWAPDASGDGAYRCAATFSEHAAGVAALSALAAVVAVEVKGALKRLVVVGGR